MELKSQLSCLGFLRGIASVVDVTASMSLSAISPLQFPSSLLGLCRQCCLQSGLCSFFANSIISALSAAHAAALSGINLELDNLLHQSIQIQPRQTLAGIDVNTLKDVTFVLGSQLLLPLKTSFVFNNTENVWSNEHLSVVSETIKSLRLVVDHVTSMLSPSLISDISHTNTSSSVIVLALTCAHQLFRAITDCFTSVASMRESQSLRVDILGSEALELTKSIQTFQDGLLHVTSLSPTDYRQLVNLYNDHENTNTQDLKIPINGKQKDNTLLRSWLDLTGGQFGKAAGLFTEERWGCFQASLEARNSIKRCARMGFLDPNTNNFLLVDEVKGLSTLSKTTSTAAATIEEQLLHHMIDQIELCTMDALPDLLHCAFLAIRAIGRDTNEKVFPFDSTSMSPSIHTHTTRELLVQVLHAAYSAATGGSACTHGPALCAFVRLAFDAAVLRALPYEDVQTFFTAIKGTKMICLSTFRNE